MALAPEVGRGREAVDATPQGETTPASLSTHPAHADRDAESDVVQSAVGRLMASNAFATGRRSRELLAYLVAETLAGRGEAINEYTIAQDVFGRDEQFDPRIDTCVRTEAWRLRRRLADYYAHEGQREPIRIGFLPRSFIPTFTARAPDEAPAATRARQTILITTLCADSESADEQRLAVRLADEIARGLFHLPDVVPLTRAADGALPHLCLRCAVHREGGAVRIIATLTGETQGDLRGVETFTLLPGARTASSVAVADGIVEMVARALAGKAEPIAVDLLDQDDRMLYLDRMLRGSSSDRSQRLTDLRRAIERYEQTIARDPLDRMTQRRLVAAMGLILSMIPTATPQVMPRLAGVAGDLLAFDDRLSDVWLTLGLASSYAYDWAGAERAFRAAIAISPLDPSPYVLLALSCLQRGEIRQALEMTETASPLDPYSPIVASGHALALLSARRFEDAATVATQALAADPDFVRLRLTLGEARLNMGQIDAALVEFDAAFQAMSQDATVCGLLGLAYGLSGEAQRATSVLSWVRQSADMRPQTPCAEAMIQLGLGAHDEALDALDRAVRRGGTPGLFVGNAVFDSIRGDQRFRQIQKRLAFMS